MLLQVKVKPGAKRGSFIETTPSGLTVYLHERPHDGEANAALVKLLAKHFGVAKTCIDIRSGATSKTKTIKIIGK